MGRFRQKVLAGLCGWWFLVASVSAQGVLEARFGSTKAAAFVVEGESRAVSVAVAGLDPTKGRLSETSPLAVDPVSRLVVFPVKGGEGLALGVAPSIGSKVTAGGVELTVESRVKQVRGSYLPFTLLRLKHGGAAPLPGTPLLDSSGKVVGLVHEPAGGQRIYALPSEVIQRILVGASEGQVARAWLGVVLNPQSSAPRVVRVVDGSPAAEAGLAGGDLLLEVGGHPVADYGDAVNAFFLLRVGESVNVKVRRNGKLVVGRLTPRASER